MKHWTSIKTFGKKFGSRFFDSFMKHDVLTLAAALAFYTALSLAPLLMITLSVVGLLGDESQVKFLAQVQSVIGSEAAGAVSTVIQNADEKPELGSFAGIVGVIVLLFSASGVFAQLQSSLNVIWEAEGAAVSGAWSWIRKRLLSMGMVISLGFVAMVSLIVSSAMTVVFENEGFVWDALNFVVSFLIFAAMFAAILKYLPDKRLETRAAIKGGIITALLFTLGKSLIGIYLGSSALGSAYGAAGSLIVLLAWVYYSSIIIFTGAELTRALQHQENGGKTPESMKH